MSEPLPPLVRADSIVRVGDADKAASPAGPGSFPFDLKPAGGFHFPSAYGPGNASIEEQNAILATIQEWPREWPVPVEWPPDEMLKETVLTFPDTFRDLVAEEVKRVLAEELPAAVEHLTGGDHGNAR